MEYNDYIELGLNGMGPVKVILCGRVEEDDSSKYGIVELVYVTLDKNLAKTTIEELIEANPDNYYMVYSVDYNTDLTTLPHYPSLEISKEDLE